MQVLDLEPLFENEPYYLDYWGFDHLELYFFAFRGINGEMYCTTLNDSGQRCYCFYIGIDNFTLIVEN